MIQINLLLILIIQITLSSSTNETNCLNSTDTFCIKCETNFILQNYHCKQIQGKCLSQSIVNCEICDSNVITTNGNCLDNFVNKTNDFDDKNNNMVNKENCRYLYNTNETIQCLSCNNGYYLTETNECENFENCQSSIDSFCVKPKETSKYVNERNEIVECPNAIECQMLNHSLISFQCIDGYFNSLTNQTCRENGSDNCIETLHGECIKCENKFILKEGECVGNGIEGCVNQFNDICFECENDLFLTIDKCITEEEIYCKEYDKENSFCYQCVSDELYKDLDGCKTKEGSIYEHCLHVKESEEKCFECYNNFTLINGECFENNLKQNKNNQNCLIYDSKGCLRCNKGYYLDNYECIPCIYPCLDCISNSTCLQCERSYFLEDSICIETNSSTNHCEEYIPHTTSCLQCQDGYYRDSNGINCTSCPNECKTCFNDSVCLTCNEGFYIIPDSSDHRCKPYNEFLNCEIVTTKGCDKCNENYYLSNHNCFKCPTECIQCNSTSQCLKCSDHYVLYDNKCIHFNDINGCKEASNSQCISCKEGYYLDDMKHGCIKQYEASYTIVIVPAILLFIVLLILFIAYIIKNYYRVKKSDYNELKDLTIFNMKKSDIQMVHYDEFLCFNKEVLKFTDEYGGETIPVGLETRELVCIGSNNLGRVQLRLQTRKNIENFEIRIHPEVVSLGTGQACEFEIFLKPLCTCEIDDEISIVAIEYSTSIETIFSLNIQVYTENSTRLSYDELKQEKKLGEGSFGIVYLGTYRGNKVAIKLLKNKVEITEDQAILQFEKEVAMLDKFRSEYIIHFFGACFIPKKVCIVTEYAPYGSIQDMINNIEMKKMMTTNMKVKLCLDAAKGIEYLHNNGILHRDIKPDNFLVVSLNENIPINAKLTDFGSSRNVNQMMTNMTFTKGIGSPTYMAPEVLMKRKYKTPADIFAFGITMFEILHWDRIYPKTMFKFPWQICEFIVQGERQIRPETITIAQYEVIQQCWCDDPHDRIDAKDLVKLIDDLFI